MKILMINKFLYPNGGSSEVRKKLHLVLDDFKPDNCHINNVEYQGLSEI